MASNEIDTKIETILISAVNRLWELEARGGLLLEDLKCFEIICKIKKDYEPSGEVEKTKNLNLDAETVMDLIKKATQKKSDG